MSVQALTYVLEGHPSKGAERLVMLSLANHAGDDFECWPSAELIAWEANISVDHARRCIHALTERGWITREINAAPDERIPADRRPNLYRIVRIEPRQRVRAKVLPAAGRVRERRGNGYANGAATGTRESPTKPSGEPSGEPSGVTPAASAADGVVPLFGDAPPKKAPDEMRERARAILADVYERRDPKPAGNYLGMLAATRALLVAGHAEDALTAAMMDDGPITIHALEMRLARAKERAEPRTNGKGAANKAVLNRFLDLTSQPPQLSLAQGES